MKASGNTVLITGGATGMGLAVARKFVAANNTVIVCGRRQDKLDEAALRVPGLHTIVADIGDAAGRAALARDVTARYPQLNVLINSAGFVKVSDIGDADFMPALYQEIATNFVGPTELAALLLPVLRRQPAATIATVTTGYVYVSSARNPGYSATKTAMHSMMQSMRYMLRDTGVRVLEIIPGPVDTDMARHYNGRKTDPEAAAETIWQALLGRQDEVLVGLSRFAMFMARVAPRFVFKQVNDGEFKAAALESGGR